MPHPRVASVHVYPVKGCKGIDVQCAYFEGTGKLAALRAIPKLVQEADCVYRFGIRSRLDGCPGKQREVQNAATEAQVRPEGHLACYSGLVATFCNDPGLLQAGACEDKHNFRCSDANQQVSASRRFLDTQCSRYG